MFRIACCSIKSSLKYCYAICVAANLQGFVTRGKLNQDKMKRTLSLLKGTLDYEDLKDVDMVIEVIVIHSPSLPLSYHAESLFLFSYWMSVFRVSL